MKNLYICGDSFAVADKNSAVTPWFKILEQRLGSDWTITNNAIVCASNFHIRLQVQNAIDNSADFVIMLATSCTRGQGRLSNTVNKQRNIIDRFLSIADGRNGSEEFGCYSYNSLDETCVFDQSQMEIMQRFRDQIFDLELEILQNKFIIESSLYTLRDSGIPFVFDQGGFENPKFSNSDFGYFENFKQHKSEINLWSLVEYPIEHRPFFHIIDQPTHQTVAEYYLAKVLDFD